MLFPVILSGGFGGRLWPLSRTRLPKQFISLITENSLLQETVMRLKGIQGLQQPTLVCNQQHRFIAAEQLRSIQVKPNRIFLESVGRNTAPAITVAALNIAKDNPDANILVLPSDHVITDLPSFQNAIEQGIKLADRDYLVTFGIVPTSPKTGYGYISKGEPIEGSSTACVVEKFVEKPDRQTAVQYMETKRYFWNSGIFLFKVNAFLREIQKHSPRIYDASRSILETTRDDLDFSWLGEEAMESCPSDSIDYAVMEKTDRAAIIPVNMGWSDVGSWGSLWEIVNKDSFGNVADGNVFMQDVNNCYIKSDKEIVATLGLEDLIIIDTDDALLVAHRTKEQEVKNVFKKLM